ncbi:MAG: hypothetical protein RIT27_328 [Pseudomonadota bacterium]|jgi:hypothetical protein
MRTLRWRLSSALLFSLATYSSSAALLLNENFNVKEKPNGWEVISVETDYTPNGWTFNDPANVVGQLGFSSNLAVIGNGTKSELRTPTLDLSANAGVVLRFKHWLQRTENSAMSVQVSTDGGTSWAVAQNYNTDFRRGLAAQSVDLSALAGGKNNVKIAFIAENPGNWLIDDVEVDGQSVPATPTSAQASLGRNSAVNLSWQSDEQNSGFIIERAGADGNWQSITPTPQPAKNFTDDGVASKTTYQYRIAAKNMAGTSNFSEPVSITTEDRTVKVYNLLVSYHDTYANTIPAKQAAIENNLKYMADAVYEMSNGAHKLGNVTIYTDAAKKDTADIVWENNIGDSGANCWFNAYTGGRIAEKGPYKRIQHCDLGGGTQNTITDNQYGGYTLAHEFGHYFYKLYDEYAQGNSPPDSPGAPSSSDSAVEFSLMQSNDDAVKAGDYRWLNLSTSANNKGNNAQFRVYGASAWDTLIRDPQNDPDLAKAQNAGLPRIFYPELQAVAPKAGEMPSLELDKAGAQAIARSELKFIWKQGALDQTARRLRLGNQPAAVIAALDVSKMVSSEQLDAMKTAVKQWVQDANVGDYISIVTIGQTAHVVQPLTNINAANAKEAVVNAINAISTTSEEPHLANGLQTALSQFQTAPTSYSAAVYLLSSGHNANGSDPFKEIVHYQSDGILLHTIGLSDDQNAEGLLSKLAEDTGGLYWQSNGALEDVAMGLDQADQVTSPAITVTLAQQAKVISGEQTFDFYVDEGVGRINFKATYTGEIKDATLTLTDPNANSFVLPADFCQTTNESLVKETVCGATVDYINRGNWHLMVKANRANLDFNYHLQGVAKDNDKIIYASVEAAGSEKVTFPQPLLVTASIGNAAPITDLTISAVLETPDGRKQPFVLRDDGVAPDNEANDGMYLGKVNYTMNGLHKIHVHFSNPDNKAKFTNKGVTYYAVPPVGVSPFTDVNIPFTRLATAEINISGVPAQLSSNSAGLSMGGNASVTASFSNHLQTSKGQIGSGITISGDENIRLASTVSPDAKHLGKMADVLIAVSYKATGSTQEVFYFKKGSNWEMPTEGYPAAYHVESLSNPLAVEIFDGKLAQLGLKGEFKAYVGYRLSDGTVVFNGANPLVFFVQ